MSGSSTNNSSTGSNGIINGVFGVVNYAEYILNNYDSVVTNSLHMEAKKRQRDIRKMARASDTEWKDIAKHIKVSYNHEERMFSYTVQGKKNQEKAMNLEYGNGPTPPVPFFRSSALQSAYDSEVSINRTMGAEFMKGY